MSKPGASCVSVPSIVASARNAPAISGGTDRPCSATIRNRSVNMRTSGGIPAPTWRAMNRPSARPLGRLGLTIGSNLRADLGMAELRERGIALVAGDQDIPALLVVGPDACWSQLPEQRDRLRKRVDLL